MTDSCRKIIIAIDGYASCGKSTVAKELAQMLQYNYVDSGAMYRAVTLFALRKGFIEEGKLNEEKLIQALGEIHLSFQLNLNEKKSSILLNDENVEKEIRDMVVSNWVSPVATIKKVRQEMVRQQQTFGERKGIVMDGRDIGTVVFPGAELKIFMTALPEIRAQRRFDEMKAKGLNASYEEILANVVERDQIDRTRQEGPLVQAADALVLDNSYLTREQQLQWIVNQVNKVLDANHN